MAITHNIAVIDASLANGVILGSFCWFLSHGVEYSESTSTDSNKELYTWNSRVPQDHQTRERDNNKCLVARNGCSFELDAECPRWKVLWKKNQGQGSIHPASFHLMVRWWLKLGGGDIEDIQRWGRLPEWRDRLRSTTWPGQALPLVTGLLCWLCSCETSVQAISGLLFWVQCRKKGGLHVLPFATETVITIRVHWWMDNFTGPLWPLCIVRDQCCGHVPLCPVGKLKPHKPNHKS